MNNKLHFPSPRNIATLALLIPFLSFISPKYALAEPISQSAESQKQSIVLDGYTYLRTAQIRTLKEIDLVNKEAENWKQLSQIEAIPEIERTATQERRLNELYFEKIRFSKVVQEHADAQNITKGKFRARFRTRN